MLLHTVIKATAIQEARRRKTESEPRISGRRRDDHSRCRDVGKGEIEVCRRRRRDAKHDVQYRMSECDRRGVQRVTGRRMTVYCLIIGWLVQFSL